MKIMPLALDETTSISISDPNISAVSQDLIAIEDTDRKARVAKLLSPSKRYSLSIQGLFILLPNSRVDKLLEYVGRS